MDVKNYKDKATSLYINIGQRLIIIAESSTNITFNENYVLGLNFVTIVRSNSTIALT